MAKTITRDELARLSFCNSKRMPKVVNDNGVRKRWVGIGWVEEGKAKGHETKVVDSKPQPKPKPKVYREFKVVVPSNYDTLATYDAKRIKEMIEKEYPDAEVTHEDSYFA